MQIRTSRVRKFAATAACTVMMMTGAAWTGFPAHAGPKEDAIAAIRHLDADTARKTAKLKRLKQQGAAADAAKKNVQEAITCYDKLNATIISEGGVPALSPARRAQLRAVRDHCNLLSVGGV